MKNTVDLTGFTPGASAERLRKQLKQALAIPEPSDDAPVQKCAASTLENITTDLFKRMDEIMKSPQIKLINLVTGDPDFMCKSVLLQYNDTRDVHPLTPGYIEHANFVEGTPVLVIDSTLQLEAILRHSQMARNTAVAAEIWFQPSRAIQDEHANSAPAQMPWYHLSAERALESYRGMAKIIVVSAFPLPINTKWGVVLNTNELVNTAPVIAEGLNDPTLFGNNTSILDELRAMKREDGSGQSLVDQYANGDIVVYDGTDVHGDPVLRDSRTLCKRVSELRNLPIIGGGSIITSLSRLRELLPQCVRQQRVKQVDPETGQETTNTFDVIDTRLLASTVNTEAENNAGVTNDQWLHTDPDNLLHPKDYRWHNEVARELYMFIRKSLIAQTGHELPVPDSLTAASADTDRGNTSRARGDNERIMQELGLSMEDAVVEKALRDGVDQELQVAGLATETGVAGNWPAWIVIVGPAGSGKTVFAEALAGALHAMDSRYTLVTKNLRSEGNEWLYGNAENNFMRLMDECSRHTYKVILLDEFFTSIPHNSGLEGNGGGGIGDRCMDYIKRVLDTSNGTLREALRRNHSILVCTANEDPPRSSDGSDPVGNRATMRHFPGINPADPSQAVGLMETLFDKETHDYYARKAGVPGKGLAYIFGLHRVRRLDGDFDVNAVIASGEEVIYAIARAYLDRCRERAQQPNGRSLDVAIQNFVTHQVANIDTHPGSFLNILDDTVNQSIAGERQRRQVGNMVDQTLFGQQ